MPRRRRRIKPPKAYSPPSARGRVLVKESLPTGSSNSIHHSEELAPAPKPVQKAKAPVKKAAAPKAKAPAKKAPAPKAKVEKKAPEKKAAPVKAEKKEEPKRAHEVDGKFQADDPATPDKNEAWKEGKSPAKPKWNSEMTKRELLKFLPKGSKLTQKSSKEAILKELGKKSG